MNMNMNMHDGWTVDIANWWRASSACGGGAFQFSHRRRRSFVGYSFWQAAMIDFKWRLQWRPIRCMTVKCCFSFNRLFFLSYQQGSKFQYNGRQIICERTQGVAVAVWVDSVDLVCSQKYILLTYWNSHRVRLIIILVVYQWYLVTLIIEFYSHTFLVALPENVFRVIKVKTVAVDLIHTVLVS